MERKTRSIVLRLPERAVALLERIADREHVTLRAFLEHRVADLVRYMVSQGATQRAQATQAIDAPDSAPGQYL